MSNRTWILAAGLLALVGLPALAQDVEVDVDVEAAEHERERIEREMAEATAEIEQAARAIEQAAASDEADRVEIEMQMRDAESRLAEAAQRIAELSMQRLPKLAGRWSTEFGDKPVLGISIVSRESDKPVEGVEVVGVSPAGPAEEAGLRAGDIVTSINGESLGAENVKAANAKLLDFMSGVDEGDTLDVEYLRNGKSGKVTLEPRILEHEFFTFRGGPGMSLALPPEAPNAPGAPRVVGNRFVFISDAGGLGDMEMVSLTEGLGRYFGTDEGLLVVRAPENADTYKLQDGDVILDIDGREPKSVSHAVRILGSYQAGESLRIRIMRDKRERTLDIEMPDNRTGSVWRPSSPVAEPKPVAPVGSPGDA